MNGPPSRGVAEMNGPPRNHGHGWPPSPPSHGVREMNEPPSHRTREINGSLSQEVAEINPLTQRIIGCAIEVHRVLGPGLLEQMYESAICLEFDEASLSYARQVRLPAYYKGRLLGEYRVDLIVEDRVL